MSLLIRFIALFLVALALLSCGGAYAEAIARGDKFAEAGQWDEAAAAYEQAAKLDPKDPEARIRLKEVRRKQAAERLQRAAALEQRGELKKALVLIQEAVRFDSESVDGQRALTRVTAAVLEKAEKLFEDGKLRKAFELTTLVLKGSKNHPRARELDDRVRSALAERSYKRAQKFMNKDKLGNALVELAACMTYRPDYPDAKLHFGQVKLELEQQLRFIVVLDRFSGKGKNATLTKGLNPDMLQQAIDERLLLSVVATKPKDEEGLHGVAVTGEFADYGFDHKKKSITRHCDYVCGKTYKPNPRIQQLRSDLARLEQTLSGADGDISRKEKDLSRAQQQQSKEEAETQKRQGDADQARNRLEQCRAKASPDDSSPCSSEESNLRSKQGWVDSARNRVESARSQADRLRNDVQSARDRRDSARQSRDQKNSDLLNTPEQIAVDKYCAHNYRVEQHGVTAKVTLKLTIAELADDKAIVADQPFKYGSQAADETFPAQAGRCAEVAGGDALKLPSEVDMRKDLMTKVVRDLRSKIMASYDAYRRGFLAAARRDEAAGLTDQATESYVRYVLTGPHALADKEKLAAFFSRTKGIGKLDALWRF